MKASLCSFTLGGCILSTLPKKLFWGPPDQSAPLMEGPNSSIPPSTLGSQRAPTSISHFAAIPDIMMGTLGRIEGDRQSKSNNQGTIQLWLSCYMAGFNAVPTVPSPHHLLEADQGSTQHSENSKVTGYMWSIRKGWECHALIPHSATGWWRVKHLVVPPPLAEGFCFLVMGMCFWYRHVAQKQLVHSKTRKKRPVCAASDDSMDQNADLQGWSFACLWRFPASQPWTLLNSAQSLRFSRGRRRQPMSNRFL